MRPPCEIRLHIEAAALDGPATLRDFYQRVALAAPVSFASVRHTVGNMARAGHLLPVGEASVDYRNRLVQVYALGCPWPRQTTQRGGAA
jgi:hypothetical protein